tara:strand:+ start:137 stop:727 length:591 start_codon:yes stop_codon:yes gene_type:complete
MSDYNITTGWYKYRNGINGKLVNVYKITKQFVAVKIYQYHDNKYDLTNMNEEDLSFHSLKTKVKVYPSNIEFPYIHPKKGSPLKFKLTHKQREDYVKPVVVNEEEEEQPPSPDDGTAEYDIDEQLAKEKKETEVVKIFAKKVKEVINDSIMKDPEVCKLIVKNHILEIIVNEIFGKDKERVDSKYYVEITDAIHKL